MAYPRVLAEIETLRLASAGRSLARFGDGELKIALGRAACAQAPDARLAKILRDILRDATGPCLPCIPNIQTATPKAAFWRQYLGSQYVGLYRGSQVYGSAFITRPDSAPWIDTTAYWSEVADLWRGRSIVLVRGSDKSLTGADVASAAQVTEILAPAQHAFTSFDELVELLAGEKRRVLICLGPTATALAWTLAQRGVHAIDLGHAGMFRRRAGRLEKGLAPEPQTAPAASA